MMRTEPERPSARPERGAIRFTNSFGLWQVCRLLFFSLEAVLRKVILTPGTRNELTFKSRRSFEG